MSRPARGQVAQAALQGKPKGAIGETGSGPGAVFHRAAAEAVWQHAAFSPIGSGVCFASPIAFQASAGGSARQRVGSGSARAPSQAFAFDRSPGTERNRRNRATGSGGDGPARTACTPRSARRTVAGSKTGGSGRLHRAFVPETERDPCAVGVYRQGHHHDARFQGPVALASTSRSALGASGVSSRDTMRGSQDKRARRLNYFLNTQPADESQPYMARDGLRSPYPVSSAGKPGRLARVAN